MAEGQQSLSDELFEVLTGVNRPNFEDLCYFLERAANAPILHQDKWLDIAECALRNGFEDCP